MSRSNTAGQKVMMTGCSVMAAELIAIPVDRNRDRGALAPRSRRRRATSTIPIVMGAIGERSEHRGLVCRNLARPGGNITGFAVLNVELDGKASGSA